MPVVSMDSPAWSKPGFAERVGAAEYGRYLEGFASPKVLFREQIATNRIDQQIRAELRRRLGGTGCPVVAWSSHMFKLEHVAPLARDLARISGQPPPPRLRVRSFSAYSEGLRRERLPPASHVLYVERQRP